MNIKTKFDLGDTLYCITTKREEYYEDCPFCGGTGKIVGKDGAKRYCPECYNRHSGKIRKYNQLAWAISGSIVVRQISVRIDAEKYREEQYMSWLRSSGGGMLWPVEKLFMTKEEAQAECDKRNKEKND